MNDLSLVRAVSLAEAFEAQAKAHRDAGETSAAETAQAAAYTQWRAVVALFVGLQGRLRAPNAWAYVAEARERWVR